MDDEIKHGSLEEALAAAQAEFPELKRNKHVTIRLKGGASFNHAYADLSEVLRVHRPICAKHGLAISFQFRYIEGRAHEVAQLLFPGSEPRENPIPVMYGDDMWSLGSAMKFAKRYGLEGLLGVDAEDDDDGAAAVDAARSGDIDQRTESSSPPAATANLRSADRTPGPPANELPPLEFFIGKIREKTTAAELLEFLDKCFGDKLLPGNLQLITGIATHVATRAQQLITEGKITAEEELRVSTHANYLLDALEMQNEIDPKSTLVETKSTPVETKSTPVETKSTQSVDGWHRLLAEIQQKLKQTPTPQGLGEAAVKAAEKWVHQVDFLRAVYDIISEINKARSRDEYVYSVDGQQYTWSQEDRDYVTQTCQSALSKLLNGGAPQTESPPPAQQPPAERPTTLAGWQALVETKQKPEELMALVSELADDEQLTRQAELFGSLCNSIAAFITAHTEAEGWGAAAAGLVRQHLLSRRDVVEVKRKARESNA